MRLQKLKTNEQGFASIVIALILIVVLALLTVGFAQLARREQQNALDKQLSTQAYYAAESGINDAYRAIKSTNPATQLTTSDPTTCLTSIPGATSNVLDATSGAQYTCVLVDLKPKALMKEIDADTAWSTAFVASATPDTLTISWSTRDSKAPSTDTQHKFTPQGAAWNHPAVMQFSLTQLDHLDRASLESKNFTVFLYPSTDTAASPAYSTALSDQGNVVPGGCTSAGACKVTINGGFPVGVTSYLLHMYGYYDDSDVTITGTTGINPLTFSDSQAVIDSTGQARNVLKRLQVHVPIFPQNDLPSYVLQAQNICKRFSTYPTSPSASQNDVSLPSVPGGFDANTPCNLN